MPICKQPFTKFFAFVFGNERFLAKSRNYLVGPRQAIYVITYLSNKVISLIFVCPPHFSLAIGIALMAN